MPRATGRRLVAAILCLIPVIGWPFAYLAWRSAKRAEKERQQELDAIDAIASQDS